MYTQDNKDFLHNCFFNNEKYLNDVNSFDNYQHISKYPSQLFFLPDMQLEENNEINATKWKDFVSEFTRMLMFEKDFHFVIYLCNGKNLLNDIIINEIAYLKFVTIDLLPSSIKQAIKLKEQPSGNINVIGTKNIKFINEEIKIYSKDAFLYLPNTFEEEFLNYLYLRNKNNLNNENEAFIKTILEIIGIKSIKKDKSKWIDHIFHGIKSS
jgi:hypothetical protein